MFSFSQLDDNISQNILGVIPEIISSEENHMLTALLDENEIRDTIDSMANLKAPGPDGFPIDFYKKFWHIIGKDVISSIMEFFQNGKILKSWNHTFIALIPKGEVQEEWKDYRPISLCNVCYKIISKLLVLRLKKILPRLISMEQGGFVEVRQILDGIIIAHECLHTTHF